MNPCMGNARGSFRRWLVACALLVGLGGCAPTTQPVAPCCYNGAVTLARLDQLRFIAPGGNSYTSAQALPGLRADSNPFGRSLPFDKVDIKTETFGRLRVVFEQYDANRDGVLQAPELILLLTVETARGLGKNIIGVRTDRPVASLQLSSAQTSALVNYIDTMRGQFNPAAQRLFADMEQLERVLDVFRNDGGPDGNRVRLF